MTTPSDPERKAGPTGNASGRAPCPDAARGVTCRECVEFLLDYIDGVLPEGQRFSFESHLAYCADCEAYMENYKKAAAMAAGMGREERGMLGAEVPAGLIEAILKARKQGLS